MFLAISFCFILFFKHSKSIIKEVCMTIFKVLFEEQAKFKVIIPRKVLVMRMYVHTFVKMACQGRFMILVRLIDIKLGVE